MPRGFCTPSPTLAPPRGTRTFFLPVLSSPLGNLANPIKLLIHSFFYSSHPFRFRSFDCLSPPEMAFFLPLMAMLFLCLSLLPSSVSSIPIDQFSFDMPSSTFFLGSSRSLLNPSPFNSFPRIPLSSHQKITPERRSFSNANRRSAHSCRWKLCGPYHNYSSLRRFLNLENANKK